MEARHDTPDEGKWRVASRVFAGWAGLIRRRPGWLTVAVVVVTVVFAGGLSRLEFDSGQGTMVSNTSQVYVDNLKYQGSFGGELMVVVFDGDIRQLFTAQHDRGRTTRHRLLLIRCESPEVNHQSPTMKTYRVTTSARVY